MSNLKERLKKFVGVTSDPLQLVRILVIDGQYTNEEIAEAVGVSLAQVEAIKPLGAIKYNQCSCGKKLPLHYKFALCVECELKQGASSEDASD